MKICTIIYITASQRHKQVCRKAPRHRQVCREATRRSLCLTCLTTQTSVQRSLTQKPVPYLPHDIDKCVEKPHAEACTLLASIRRFFVSLGKQNLMVFIVVFRTRRKAARVSFRDNIANSSRAFKQNCKFVIFLIHITVSQQPRRLKNFFLLL